MTHHLVVTSTPSRTSRLDILLIVNHNTVLSSLSIVGNITLLNHAALETPTLRDPTSNRPLQRICATLHREIDQ